MGGLYSRHVNVNIRFTSIQRTVIRHREVGSINQGRNRISALRNPRSIGFVVEINIWLGEVVTLLVETKRVALSCLFGIWDMVQGLNTGRSNLGSAFLEIHRKRLRLLRNNCGCDRVICGLRMSQVRRSLRHGAPLVNGTELLLDNGTELDTGSNIVNVCLDVFRDVIPNTVKRVQSSPKQRKNLLLAANLKAGSARMLMFMELSLKQSLYFMSIGIKSQPSLIIGVYNAGSMNPRRFKPSTNRVNRILWRSEQIMNFLWSPILSILGRARVRTI